MNKRNFTFLFVVAGILFFLSGFSLKAQQAKEIIIIHADAYNYNEALGKDVQRLIGNVELMQDSVLFFSDSTYLNDKEKNFEAFGNVHINIHDTLNIFGNRLLYNGKSKVAELFGNVILIDPKAKLTANHLIYNRKTKMAYYDNGGTIYSDTNVLKSQRGYYNIETKVFYFRRNVSLKSPDQTTFSDTLTYNSASQVAYFNGFTKIVSKESTIECTKGWYDTKREISKLYNGPEIFTNTQKLHADSLIYNNKTTFGQAYGNISIVDTSRQLIIKGNIAALWNDLGKTYVTGNSEAITYDSQDSLYMHSDTLWLYFNKKKKAKKLLAYHGVRFFRTDLQGVCDSLAYTMKDSTMRMFTSPVLWSGKNQLTSDTIIININHNKADSMELRNNAFIVSQDSITSFNQIKGRNMTGYFHNNALYKIKVNGNAQSLYWVRNDSHKLIGINKADAGYMVINIKNNKIITIRYFDQPEETLFPVEKLIPSMEKLQGFSWKEKLRPKSRKDIFLN